MPIERTRTQKYLRAFDFKTLFREELGWDNFGTTLRVPVESTIYQLDGIAEKRGVAVFLLSSAADVPSHELRRKIERQVALRHREHLIIYTDGKTTQVWQWMRDEAGKALASREHRYDVTHSGESLIQKLELLAISIEEEEKLNLPGVLRRVRSAFDVERVTRRFYDQFKSQHNAFAKFLKGVPVGDLSDWYVSVMLNRLMFIYFIQKKGFLTGDQNYLRNRLAASQERGADRFYRDFLCPLFFDGFATPLAARSPEVKALLGNVPYLNGGIFARHQIEQAHGQDIQILDKAFDKLFDFFEDYQWHLDDRPLHNDNEINPDVLGYIFEKYINQKQMGAYYTKEDITEYIGRNTIVPYLLDAACRAEPSFFKADGPVWKLLTVNPERYIYPAVAKGAEIPLPPEVAAGVEDVGQRSEWNKPTADEYALPTEIWRETIARRLRYAEVRAKLAAGEVCSTSDLITYNLNIRRFVQDVIDTCEDARLLRALWKAIRSITVLDPTCGSGAFHFAALNILEPMYEGCLKRMAALVADEDRSGGGHARYEDFRKALAEVARHPNQRYFINKSIIVDNLYGVDIMHEAVEIAKLRLFLKLVSLVDDASKIEPLPDIDFNIRAGNTLVGFATREEMLGAVRGDRLLLLPEDQELIDDIEERAEDIDRLFTRFRQMQTDCDLRDFGDDYAATKQALRQRLGVQAGQLDRLLAQQYGVNPDTLEFERWRESHQPFHWFAEFYGIVKQGGFDAIVGNPPYVQYNLVRREYKVQGYHTERSNNLYGMVLERSCKLINSKGLLGMIVPMSLVSTDLAGSVREVLFGRHDQLWFSHYSGDAHPGILFTGVKMRLTIVIGRVSSVSRQSSPDVYSTNFMRWYTEERDYVFDKVLYVRTPIQFHLSGLVPKIGSNVDLAIMEKLRLQRKPLSAYVSDAYTSTIYAHRIVAHFIKAFTFIPYFRNERDGQKKSEDYKIFSFRDQAQAICANTILNSTTFYYYYLVYSDAYHCGRELVLSFPCMLDAMRAEVLSELTKLNGELVEDLRLQSKRRRIKYRNTGWIEYDEFYPRLSKPIMNRIDAVLAQHYGFTDEELDFIINYDIKYRMGDSLGDGGEEV